MKEYRVFCEVVVKAKDEEEALERGHALIFDDDYQVEEV